MHGNFQFYLFFGFSKPRQDSSKPYVVSFSLLFSKPFLFRVAQEGGLPKDKDVTTVVNAVFAALKARLSDSSIAVITEAMPGEVKQMWKSA